MSETHVTVNILKANAIHVVIPRFARVKLRAHAKSLPVIRNIADPPIPPEANLAVVSNNTVIAAAVAIDIGKPDTILLPLATLDVSRSDRKSVV